MMLMAGFFPFLLNFSGTAPTHLGLHDGKLSLCPQTPNCVCSQDPDPAHKIDALTFKGAKPEARKKLRAIIESTDDATIVLATDNYLRAEFKSKMLGFVDDVEFLVETNQIQVRSASRLGRSDFGVNRKRIEKIRDRFKAP